MWVDVCEPDTADLAAIAEELQLHPLAVEDAVTEHQRPSSTGTTRTCSSPRTRSGSTPAPAELVTAEVDAFVTRHALVTVRKDESVRHRRRASRAGTAPRTWPSTGSRSCCRACSTTSSTATSTPCRRSTTRSRSWRTCCSTTARRSQEVQRRSFELRKSLVLLRRVVLPMREVVNSLMRRDLHVVDQRDDAVLPGRLRPRAARDRVDRVAARPRDDHPRDEPDDPGQPAQPRS